MVTLSVLFSGQRIDRVMRLVVWGGVGRGCERCMTSLCMSQYCMFLTRRL